MARNLAPGGRSRLFVIEVDSGEKRLIHESSTRLFEAPNWSGDGRRLVVNGDGLLFRLDVENPAGEPEQIDLGSVPSINNDHVLSPDDSFVYVSADDGHLYAVTIGTGESRRVSNDRGSDFRYFLHGVSPDGATLAYIGLQVTGPDSFTTNVFTIPEAGGTDIQLTDDGFADDGSEYSPDGEWIHFNSERGSTERGHAQLFRMRPDGSGVEQLTTDERVNWFPHVSPDGTTIAYISFPPGTIGHPADKDVIIRLISPTGGESRDLVAVFGGQGTMNVPSWSPDSTRIAYVDYPTA